MKNLILSAILILTSMAVFGQNDCTSLLKLDPIYEINEKTHYIFTGSDTSGLNLVRTKIVASPAKIEKVKRRLKDCYAVNQEDCFEEVVIEVPPVTMTVYTLTDPTKTTFYDIRKESVEVTKRAGGEVNAKIICPKNRTTALVKKIQNALIAKGYPLEPTGVYDEATKLSISDFQRTQKLAYGDLSQEVISKLGIK